MDVHVTDGPAYALAVVRLAAQEVVNAEAGAMVAMSAGVEPKVTTAGSMGKAMLRRMLTDETLLFVAYHAMASGVWVALASPYPGDVTAVAVTDRPLIVQAGSLLGFSSGVEISTGFGGARMVVAKEGAFLLKASGNGQVLLSSYGAIHTFHLGEGEHLVVDSGHFVAMDASVSYKTGMLAGPVTAALSGEGMVFQFTGPGSVMIQTRAPQHLASLLNPSHAQNKAR